MKLNRLASEFYQATMPQQKLVKKGATTQIVAGNGMQTPQDLLSNAKIQEVVQIYSKDGTMPLDLWRKKGPGQQELGVGEQAEEEEVDIGTFTQSLENITLFILNRQQSEASEAANYLTEAMMEDKKTDEDEGDSGEKNADGDNQGEGTQKKVTQDKANDNKSKEGGA